MSMRSMWSGSIEFGGLPIPVNAVKALQDDPDDVRFNEICPTHKRKLTRVSVCSGGCLVHPKSDPNGVAAKLHYVEADEDGDEAAYEFDQIEVAKGFPVAPDQFAVISAEQIEQINAATKLPTLTIDRFVPAEQVISHPASYDTYYLRANDKVPGSDKAVKLLVEAMRKANVAAVSKWTPRDRQHLVVFYPDTDGVLVMRKLTFSGQLRQPDEKCLAHQQATVSDQEVEMAGQLIAALSGDFDHDTYADDAASKRAELVQQVIDGEEIEIPEEEQPVSGGDLSGLLAAAVENVTAAA